MYRAKTGLDHTCRMTSQWVSELLPARTRCSTSASAALRPQRRLGSLFWLASARGVAHSRAEYSSTLHPNLWRAMRLATLLCPEPELRVLPSLPQTIIIFLAIYIYIYIYMERERERQGSEKLAKQCIPSYSLSSATTSSHTLL